MSWDKTEKKVIEECTKSLRTLTGVRATWNQSPSRNEATLELSGDWGRKMYLVEVKNLVTRESAHLIHSFRNHRRRLPLLLMTSYVNVGLGKELREKEIEYVDTVGNMYITSPPLHIDVSGKKPRSPLGRRKRTFHTKAIQLIYIFLREPSSVNWQYRKLARSADIALGSVGRTLEELRGQGFLASEKEGQRKLINWRQLLERWEIAYLDVLRPKMILARARLPKGGFDEIVRRASGGGRSDFYLGGELGAATLTGYLVPQEATLHVTKGPLEVMKSLKLIPDDQGPVHFIKTWGEYTLWEDKPDGIAFVDPILMHAELLRDPDDRLRETAEVLLKNHILPRINRDHLEE